MSKMQISRSDSLAGFVDEQVTQRGHAAAQVSALRASQSPSTRSSVAASPLRCAPAAQDAAATSGKCRKWAMAYSTRSSTLR
jgi:hypothetical protein